MSRPNTPVPSHLRLINSGLHRGAVSEHAIRLITDGADDARNNPEQIEAEAGICDQDTELERCGMVV